MKSIGNVKKITEISQKSLIIQYNQKSKEKDKEKDEGKDKDKSKPDQ